MKKIGDSNRQYKIRADVTVGEVKYFALTVPSAIAAKFENVSFSVYSLSSSIVFESGAKILPMAGSKV